MADSIKYWMGDFYQNGAVVNTVIEIPQGSFLKIEGPEARACFMLTVLVEYLPVNYGFIPSANT